MPKQKKTVELYAQSHEEAYAKAEAEAKNPPWSRHAMYERIAESLRVEIKELIAQERTWIRPSPPYSLDIDFDHEGIDITVNIDFDGKKDAAYELLHYAHPREKHGFTAMVDKFSYRMLGAEKYVEKKTREILMLIAAAEGRLCFQHGLPPAPGLAAVQAKLALEASAGQAKPSATRRAASL